MQEKVVMMEIKKVLPVIFTLRSDFRQFSLTLIVEVTFIFTGTMLGTVTVWSIHTSVSTAQRSTFKIQFFTTWPEHCGGKKVVSVFVCLLLISVKASFVLVTQNTTGNPWMIHRCTDPISFFHLLLLIFAHNRTHKQTNTQYLWLSHSVDKDSLSSLFLTCKHTQLGSEMSISRLIPSLFSLRSASLTPHLSQ